MNKGMQKTAKCRNLTPHSQGLIFKEGNIEKEPWGYIVSRVIILTVVFFGICSMPAIVTNLINYF